MNCRKNETLLYDTSATVCRTECVKACSSKQTVPGLVILTGYYTARLNITKFYLSSHTVQLCVLYRTVIISLHNINWLIFTTNIVFTTRYGLDI